MKAGRFRILRVLRISLGWVLLLGCLAWAFGALWFDFPFESWRHPVAFFFLLAAVLALIWIRPGWYAKLGLFIIFLFIATAWLTLQPDDHQLWQADVGAHV